MREIKFRVWDCHTKEMAGPKGLRIDFDNGVIDHIEFKFSDYGSWGNATRPLDQERYKVMQFTGLHDKNGKEIYEGDIIAAKFQPHYVERVSWQGPPDVIAKVFWDYNGFRLEAVGDNDNRYADFTDFERLEHADGMMVDMATEHSEVIGNIYENPELLEAK